MCLDLDLDYPSHYASGTSQPLLTSSALPPACTCCPALLRQVRAGSIDPSAIFLTSCLCLELPLLELDST